ncbi:MULTISPECIES: ribonuclease HIII [Gracilibacillus]|uniref:ribonuclease HIII n=1 Tax=Gracilibacillus TaxID=74385 RepID=UPI000826150B|nr:MULTISPECIES: ribonuclease HIII [Gracilibacillus]
MSNVVLQIPPKHLQKIKDYYAQHITKVPPNSLFLAKKNMTTITAYKSGKVMFQGDQAETEAKQWNELAFRTKASSAKTVNQHDYAPPTAIFQQAHIGTDEAGTGDYFGPVTVSAAYVPQDQIKALQTMGITDSKTITDQNIARLTKEIVQLKIPYTLLTLPNRKYNQLQKKGWNQGKIKAMLHQHAIDKLLAKIGAKDSRGIVIDQFCQPAAFLKHIQQEGLKLAEKTYFMTKAESYSTSVAVASILARARFVREMDRLSEQYGITIPKGASNRVDETAAYLIKQNGIEALDDIAKMHFANTDKAMRYLH